MRIQFNFRQHWRGAFSRFRTHTSILVRRECVEVSDTHNFEPHTEARQGRWNFRATTVRVDYDVIRIEQGLWWWRADLGDDYVKWLLGMVQSNSLMGWLTLRDVEIWERVEMGSTRKVSLIGLGDNRGLFGSRVDALDWLTFPSKWDISKWSLACCGRL